MTLSGGRGVATGQPHAPGAHVEAATARPPLGVLPHTELGQQPIDLKTLLQTIAELGAASLSLVAWELYTDHAQVTDAWSQATRCRLLRRAFYEMADREWQYKLTTAGKAQLDLLEGQITKPCEAERTIAATHIRNKGSRLVSRPTLSEQTLASADALATLSG